MTLDNLAIGKKARVKSVLVNHSMRGRFMDIGLIPGSIVHCILQSPFKDPKAYQIRGALIAIRKEDAKDVLVEVIS